MQTQHEKFRQNIWELKGIYKRKTERRAQLVQSTLAGRKCRIVLDIGCAEGYVTKCLSHISKTVVGVDVDIYYLKLARQKVPQASFINASLECLPFRNELFDAVVILEVLEHVPNNIQIKGLAEVSKVMKRNVPLLISVPYKETISYIQCVHCKNQTPTHPSGHLHSLDEGNVAALLPATFVLSKKIHLPNMVRISCSRPFSIFPIRLWLQINNLLGFRRRKGYWLFLSFLKK
jgi:ubiquinone/menaquinone biosynthesis C-methylase UbiE